MCAASASASAPFADSHNMKELATLFVRDLTVIDCSYLHHDRGLLGESWIVDIELTGELDEQGMVFDFGHVKKQIKQLIDERVDHKLLVPEHGKLIIERHKQQTSIWFEYNGRKLFHRSPHDAICLISASSVGPDQVSEKLKADILAIAPDNVTDVEITLRTEDIAGAQYQYSHGLKKHLGNCQRIAHGHRSALEIYLDDIRQPLLEKQWAKQWQDIYIGSREDLVDEEIIDGVACYRFAYEAQQGEFELLIEQARSDIIETDSTVELIARHIQAELAKRHPQNTVRVIAYEGVGKGAIC